MNPRPISFQILVLFDWVESMDRTFRTRGYTLFQLMVVMACIGGMMALMLPFIQAAREDARRSQCVNNLKGIGVALHNYNDTYKRLPFNSQSGNPYLRNGQQSWIRGARGSVLFKILPYIYKDRIFHVIKEETNNFREPEGLMYRYWDRNGDGIQQLPDEQYFTDIHIPSYWCPSADSPKWETNGQRDYNQHALTCYSMSVGAQRRDSEGGCDSANPEIVGPLITHRGDYWDDPSGTDPGDADWGNEYRGAHISGVFSATYYSSTFGEITDGLANTFFAGEFLPNRTEDAWDWGWMIGHAKGAVLGTAAPCNAPVGTRGGASVAAHLSIDPTGTLLSHPCAEPGDHVFGFGFKSVHTGNGCNMLLGDGSVHFFFHRVDYTIWQRFGSRKDGTVLIMPS